MQGLKKLAQPQSTSHLNKQQKMTNNSAKRISQRDVRLLKKIANLVKTIEKENLLKHFVAQISVMPQHRYINGEEPSSKGNYKVSNNKNRRQSFCSVSLPYLTKPRLIDELTSDCTPFLKLVNQQGLFPEFSNDSRFIQSLLAKGKLQIVTKGQEVKWSKNSETRIKVLVGQLSFETTATTKQPSSSSGQQILDSESNQSQFRNKVYQRGEWMCNEQENGIYTALSDGSYMHFPIQAFNEVTERHNLYLEVSRLLKKTAMFCNFGKLELFKAISDCVELDLPKNSYVFESGQQWNEYMYIILEGEIEVCVKGPTLGSKPKCVSVCVLTEGTLFGDQNGFPLDLDGRPYSTRVSSTQARVVKLQFSLLTNLLVATKSSLEIYDSQTHYSSYISRRLSHYQSQLCSQSSRLPHPSEDLQKKPFRSTSRNKLNKYLKMSDPIRVILRGRTETEHPPSVSFENPLFSRRDFPELEGLLKRFENAERIALSHVKLPRLTK